MRNRNVVCKNIFGVRDVVCWREGEGEEGKGGEGRGGGVRDGSDGRDGRDRREATMIATMMAILASVI